MQNLLLIGLGSFFGGVSRYLLSVWVQQRFFSTFPYGTLSVNVLGCFLIGILFGAAERFNLGPSWRFLLVTGFCGGFTTFSAFSVETMALLRDGQWAEAMTYVGSSVVLGLAATIAGFALMKLAG